MSDTLYHEFGNRWERPGSVAATDFVPMLVTVGQTVVQSFVPLSMLPGGSGGTTGVFDVINANIVTANTFAGNLNGTGSGTFNGSFTGTLVSNQLGAGRTLFVDSAGGSDATGARGSSGYPFLTPGAAKAAAQAGDVAVVRPGSYAVTASLAKNGVNWVFMPGASVSRADNGAGGIWDDGGSAMTFTVAGLGDFTRTSTATGIETSVVKTSHASSNVTVHARNLTLSSNVTGTSSANANAVHCAAGRLSVTFDLVTVAGTGVQLMSGVYWSNGELRATGNDISSSASQGYGVWSECNATPTGDALVRVGKITSAYAPVTSNGTNGVAAVWVYAQIIKGTSSSGTHGVTNEGENRVYVFAQKIFGRLESDGGLLYVTADKVSAIGNGLSVPNLVYVNGIDSDVRLSVQHWDPAGFTGQTIVVTDGVTRIRGGDLTTGGADGVAHNGGTLRLEGVYLNAAGNAAGNPVAANSDGGLVLDNCTLIAHAGRDSITSAAPVTVTNYGSRANTAKNANVTVAVQALLVDSAVA